MQGHLLGLAILTAGFAGWARAGHEVQLADTAERLTASEEKAARRAVCDRGPTITSWDRDRSRGLVVPKELQSLYNEKPQATVRLLLKIVDGGRAWDSIHAVTCIEALVETPEFAAITAQGSNDATWDDVIGGANPLTFRAHNREVCVKLIAKKEHGKAGKPAEREFTRLVNVDAFPVAHREAARSVAVSITESKESPKEFFAEVEPKKDGSILVFHLWHESAFKPHNRDVEGNPGGKCRDVHYDVKQRKVTKTLFWQ